VSRRSAGDAPARHDGEPGQALGRAWCWLAGHARVRSLVGFARVGLLHRRAVPPPPVHSLIWDSRPASSTQAKAWRRNSPSARGEAAPGRIIRGSGGHGGSAGHGRCRRHPRFAEGTELSAIGRLAVAPTPLPIRAQTGLAVDSLPEQIGLPLASGRSPPAESFEHRVSRDSRRTRRRPSRLHPRRVLGLAWRPRLKHPAPPRTWAARREPTARRVKSGTRRLGVRVASLAEPPPSPEGLEPVRRARHPAGAGSARDGGRRVRRTGI
jgi:hypothetical protein